MDAMLEDFSAFSATPLSNPVLLLSMHQNISCGSLASEIILCSVSHFLQVYIMHFVNVITEFIDYQPYTNLCFDGC